jgi:hypothetical protein
MLAGTAWADDPRVDELERRLDVVTRELESLRLGEAADTAAYRSAFGLAPAASKVYAARHGVSIGGYGEALYENFDAEREDGGLSSKRDQLDFVRQILYVGFKFNDELLFNSEIELEHAGVRDEAEVEGQADLGTGEVEGEAELSGEVALEFAYVDWMKRREFGVRGGLLLVPVGLTNEFHEPPVFLGTRRPDVEQRVIPTTWRANGIGVFGELPAGVAYRAYVVEGLNFAGFDPAQPLRDARQSGSKAAGDDFGLAARADWVGTPGLLAGASVYSGASGQAASDSQGRLRARATLWEVHARFEWRGLDARALWAQGALDDAARVNAALGLAGSGGLGESFGGGYVEAAYDVLPHLWPGTSYGLAPYARYETYDTQEDVPAGFTENPAFERTTLTAGAALRPHPNVVLKADRQVRRNDAGTETSQWNVALGYLF